MVKVEDYVFKDKLTSQNKLTLPKAITDFLVSPTTMKQIFIMGLLKVEEYGQIHMKLTLPQRKGFSPGL